MVVAQGHGPSTMKTFWDVSIRIVDQLCCGFKLTLSIPNFLARTPRRRKKNCLVIRRHSIVAHAPLYLFLNVLYRFK